MIEKTGKIIWLTDPVVKTYVSKSSFVIIPIAIETLNAVITSLNYLKYYKTECMNNVVTSTCILLNN